MAFDGSHWAKRIETAERAIALASELLEAAKAGGYEGSQQDEVLARAISELGDDEIDGIGQSLISLGYGLRAQIIIKRQAQ